jgi:hypothetical protein
MASVNGQRAPVKRGFRFPQIEYPDSVFRADFAENIRVIRQRMPDEIHIVRIVFA